MSTPTRHSKPPSSSKPPNLKYVSDTAGTIYPLSKAMPPTFQRSRANAYDAAHSAQTRLYSAAALAALRSQDQARHQHTIGFAAHGAQINLAFTAQVGRADDPAEDPEQHVATQQAHQLIGALPDCIFLEGTAPLLRSRLTEPTDRPIETK